mmetsp:Transcript_40984/g.79794  ORF Transcript_40984/g.79794 Transcript_40984/m.79794 type:complete len:417 (-) Transcript_40984:162-1412(-)
MDVKTTKHMKNSGSSRSKKKIEVSKDVPAPFRVSIFDLLSGAAGETLDPLECEVEMEITSTVMLALGLPGYEHLRSSPRVQLFEYIVQPGVVLAVLMYLVLTRFLYGMVPAWQCLWRWMLWGGIWSQVGPMFFLLTSCKRTEYGSPQQMDLIFFGYLIHNSPPGHHCVCVYGASIEEANGTYVREGARDGAPRYVRRTNGKQYSICRRTRRRPNTNARMHGASSDCRSPRNGGSSGLDRTSAVGLNGNGNRALTDSKWWITQTDQAGTQPEKRFYTAVADNGGYCPPETGWIASRGTQATCPKLKLHREGPVPKITMGIIAAGLDLFSVGSIVYGLSIAFVVALVDTVTPNKALAGTATGWMACAYLLGRGWMRSRRYWGYLELLWQRKRCVHGPQRWECKICDERRRTRSCFRLV